MSLGLAHATAAFPSTMPASVRPWGELSFAGGVTVEELPGPATNRRRTRAVLTMTSVRSSAAFEELAVPLLPSLLNHACWLTRDPTEAEDLTQEALSKALRGFDRFTEGTNFKAWIFRILRNTFLTSRTGLATARTSFIDDHEGLEETLSAGATPEQIVIRLDNAAAVQEALNDLPAPLRDCLLLCDVEEMKYKEIAVVLDVPIGTVMSRISRARAALRERLQSQFRRRP